MLTITTPPVVAHGITPDPVPSTPEPTPEILDAASRPLFTGQYTAVERDTWRVGMPLFGTKVSSSRDVTFTNEFNVLKTSSPMVEFASTSFDEAVRKARDTVFAWSDPALGGQIYSSVGAAVLQAKDGAYFIALVGSGDPQTSGSELGYRMDRFDDNIHGILKRSTDAKAASPWSAPVDEAGNVVDQPTPDNAREIRRRDVQLAEITAFLPHTPMLKAIVDIRHLYRINPPTDGVAPTEVE
ncbi:MAG: hypothetical protein JWL76_1833 [Thermoleophilia bacterium]|nr:hypothetical protein [Thermoleophilia bacterium]